jgi:hypothetical protein
MELRQQHAAAMQAISDANTKIEELAETLRGRSSDTAVVEKLEALLAAALEERGSTRTPEAQSEAQGPAGSPSEGSPSLAPLEG